MACGLVATLRFADRDAALLASLEPAKGTPSELAAAWDEELGRRLASVDAGETFESWDAVRERALARLRHGR